MIDTPDLAVKDAPSTESGTGARQFVSEYLRALDVDDSFSAVDFFDRHPECARFKSVVLEVTLEEYVRRSCTSEQLAPSDIAAQFPEYHTAIARQIEVYQLLEDSSELGDLENWPEPGEKFLDLQVQELLGVGAFSKVFLATEPQLGDRQVVVKVCHGAAAEAAFLGRLGHAHITPIHWHRKCEQTGLSAIVMPYLARSTMADVIDHCFSNGRQPHLAAEPGAAVNELHFGTDFWREEASTDAAFSGTFSDGAVRWAIQLADALAFAHRRNICHSDIKPSNVLMTPSGNAVLVDFSMANDLAVDRKTIGGTFPYMAPEQLEAFLAGNDIPVSFASDIFSFGVTLYEFLTGRLPFGYPPDGLSHHATAEWLCKQQTEGAASVSSVNRQIPNSVSAVVMQCLALDPSARPESGIAVRDQFNRETSTTHRIRNTSRRHRKKLSALCATITVAASLAIAYVMTGGYQRELDLGKEALIRDDAAVATDHFTRAFQLLPDEMRRSETAFELLFRRGQARLVTYELELDTGRTQDARITIEAALTDFADANRIRDTAHSTAALAFCHALKALNHRGTLQERRDFGTSIQNSLNLFKKADRYGLATPAVHFNSAYLEYRLMRGPEIASPETEIDSLMARLNVLRNEVTDSPNVHLLLIQMERERAARDQRLIDTNYVDAALEQFPDDPEVLARAALNYANNSKQAENPGQSEEFYKQSRQHWIRAVANGATDNDWRALKSSNGRIENDSDFPLPDPANSTRPTPISQHLLLNPLGEEDARSNLHIATTEP